MVNEEPAMSARKKAIWIVSLTAAIGLGSVSFLIWGLSAKPIAVVMGEKVYESQLMPDTATIERGKEGKTPEQYADWLMDYKTNKLRWEKIHIPLMNRVLKKQGVDVTRAELEKFDEAREQMYNSPRYRKLLEKTLRWDKATARAYEEVLVKKRDPDVVYEEIVGLPVFLWVIFWDVES